MQLLNFDYGNTVLETVLVTRIQIEDNDNSYDNDDDDDGSFRTY